MTQVVFSAAAVTCLVIAAGGRESWWWFFALGQVGCADGHNKDGKGLQVKVYGSLLFANKRFMDYPIVSLEMKRNLLHKFAEHLRHG